MGFNAVEKQIRLSRLDILAFEKSDLGTRKNYDKEFAAYGSSEQKKAAVSAVAKIPKDLADIIR